MTQYVRVGNSILVVPRSRQRHKSEGLKKSEMPNYAERQRKHKTIVKVLNTAISVRNSLNNNKVSMHNGLHRGKPRKVGHIGGSTRWRRAR